MRRMLFIMLLLVATPCAAHEKLVWLGEHWSGIAYDGKKNVLALCYPTLRRDENGKLQFRAMECPHQRSSETPPTSFTTLLDKATPYGRRPTRAMILTDGRLLLY